MSKETQPALQLPDGITQEQVNAWKEQFGSDKVKLAYLKKDESGTRIPAVMHTPTRTVIGEFEKWSDSNPDKAKEILIKGCVLGESTRNDIMASGNDLLFFSAFNACSKLIPKAESEILNL